MLKVSELIAGYGSVQILRGVSMSIEQGQIVALLGSNGVGKTTFAAALTGLLKPWGGQIEFDGHPIHGKRARDLLELGIVHVPEGRHIFPNLTVQENLVLGAYRRGKAERNDSIEKVFTTFARLKERSTQKAGTLSGGEQQMLAIGRGMMALPRLLILDEPSIGLSPLLVEEMFELIKQLNEAGLTILLVEQNVLQSMEIADHAFVMENGEIRLSGEPAQMMQDPQLQRSYLGLA